MDIKHNLCISLMILTLISFLPLSASAENSIVFSPDNTLIAIGKNDGSFEVREIPSGKLLDTLSQLDNPPDPMSSINYTPRMAFSPDGKILASASGSAPVTLWDVKRLKKIKTLQIPSVGYDLTFSNDGTVIAGIGMDGKAGPHRLTVWNTKSGQAIKSLTLEMKLGRGYSQNRILSLKFPDSGNVMAVETIEDGQQFVRILDIKTGKENVKIKVTSWSLSSNGKYVVATRSDQTGNNYRYSIWDANSGKVIHESLEKGLFKETAKQDASQKAKRTDEVAKLDSYYSSEVVQQQSEQKSDDRGK